MVFSFCLPLSPLLNGRCLTLSSTIILPLIQCLALLHWLPIGSCSGGMHWLHLPAGRRIPAFLNKALGPTSLPMLLLTWLPRATTATASHAVWTPNTKLCWRSNSLSDVATAWKRHHIQYGERWRQTEPAGADHRKHIGEIGTWRSYEEEHSSEWSKQGGFIQWSLMWKKGALIKIKQQKFKSSRDVNISLSEGTKCSVMEHIIKLNWMSHSVSRKPLGYFIF